MDKVTQFGHNRQKEHPVDELARVRREIRALKEREAELRARIIETKDFQGADHKARLATTTRDAWDHKALKEEFGMAKLRPFVSRVPLVMLKIEGGEDGE